MSDKQPEALRLADALEGIQKHGKIMSLWQRDGDMEVIAELRRQHAMNLHLLEALVTANEIAQTLESVINEIDQSSSSYLLGACYEASKRLLNNWWQLNAATLAKTKEQP